MKRYFEVKKAHLGVSGTAQAENMEIHYYAKQVNGLMQLYLVSKQGNPTQIEMDKVPMEDFEKRFKACDEHKCPYENS